MKLPNGEIVNSYTEYFASKWWTDLKKRLPRKKCWWCGQSFRKDWNVIGHHRTRKSYSRLGRERLGIFYRDVVPVCQACHSHNSKAHRKMHKCKRDGTSITPAWEFLEKGNFWTMGKRIRWFLFGAFVVGVAWAIVHFDLWDLIISLF